jgi:hypothetical protein
MAVETYISRETLALYRQIAEVVALEPCKGAAEADNSQFECRMEWPNSSEDWCLSCMARRAKAGIVDRMKAIRATSVADRSRSQR